MPHKYQDYMGDIDLQEVIDYALDEFQASSVHGIHHWNRVARFGRKIAASETDVNERVVILFAYLHDHKRENDWEDVEHGPRAAEALEDLRNNLLADLSDLEFNQLKQACELHTLSDGTDDPTVNACFDADRLDLGRVGIAPDPDRMITNTAALIALGIE